MRLLTVRAAAERLDVAYSTLKRWVHTGHVRTTKTEGGHHRVSEAEVERLIARQHPESRRRESSTNDEALGGLSARNRLHGFVDEVRVDGLLAQVRLRVGDQSLTAVITAMQCRPEAAAGRRRHCHHQVDGSNGRRRPGRFRAAGRERASRLPDSRRTPGSVFRGYFATARSRSTAVGDTLPSVLITNDRS